MCSCRSGTCLQRSSSHWTPGMTWKLRLRVACSLLRYLAAQPLAEKRFRDRRQRNEASRSFEDAVGDERMHVGVEVDQVAEGLDEEDEGGAGAGQGGAVGLRERSRDDAAELSEKRSTIR